jgi:hypothetical protein
MAAFEYRQAEEIRDTFARHQVRYLFILDDIIASKQATGRIKDRESLPRLRAFRTYWLDRRRDS